MRKRTLEKRRSCGLCKPHKRGVEQRWKARDLAEMKAAEEEIRSAVSHPNKRMQLTGNSGVAYSRRVDHGPQLIRRR